MGFAPTHIESGLVVADIEEAVSGHVNGLPFTNNGELCVEINGAPNHWVGGLPFSSAGRLCVEDASPSHWQNGVGFTSNGRVAFGGSAGSVVLNGMPFNGYLSLTTAIELVDELIYGGDTVTYGGVSASY